MRVQSSRDCSGVTMPYIRASLFLTLLFSIATSCKKEVESTTQIQTEEVQTAALSSMLSSNVQALPVTQYAALVSDGTMDQKMNVMQMLGVNIVRYAIVLESNTSTDKGYEKWRDAGYTILLNLNWGHVSDNNGGRTAVPFPTDLVEYKKELEAVLDLYHPAVAVIENEETTDIFHSGPITDYINELKVAVSVCKKRGIKVADGGLNLELCQQVMNGTGRGINYDETKQLIAAFATMNLDYVNVHTKAPFSNQKNGSQFAPGVAESVADYLRQQTGKQVMCNEYNNHNTSTSLMTTAVAAFTAGNYAYFTPRSDNTSSDSYPLANVNGSKLTSLGIAYRNSIK